MPLTVEDLKNDDRFCGENVLQFLIYMPFGIVLLLLRTFLALILWVAAIILPNKWAMRQMLSTLACWTFGVYVRVKGTRDPRCSVMVANYVSCLDSLAVSHVLGTISLRKWKVPPFFASTLGIRNASQFIRKQHFAECPSKPVLLQPEGGPTNGKGLLRFTDWPFQLGNRVQPVAITLERPFTHATVHRFGDSRERFPWSDAWWFLWTPVTLFTVRALPPVPAEEARDTIAAALQIETTDFKWEELNRPLRRRVVAGHHAVGGHAAGGHAVGHHAAGGHAVGELERRARQVREVLPTVPMKDILKDLVATRCVDVTITNFLEGITPYTPEELPAAATTSAAPTPGPSAGPSKPRYITPAPTGVFPKTARERQLSFQEKKAQMIAEARQKYIEKHGLVIPANC